MARASGTAEGLPKDRAGCVRILTANNFVPLWLRAVILKRANPLLGGGVTKKIAAKPLYRRRRGGVPCAIDISEHHPVLAVMRGGEFAFLKRPPIWTLVAPERVPVIATRRRMVVPSDS